MAKKIFALVATVVLVVCFAVTVSAVNVSTTTTYVAGETAMANVSVTVSDVTEGNNVTYYAAASEGNEVFVDQKKVETGATSVTFDYTTAYANVNTAVLVGYTGATAEEDTIPEAGKYTITYGGVKVGEVYQGQEGGTFTFDYVPGAYTVVESVSAEGAVVVGDPVVGEGTITVTLAEIEGNVVLSVATAVKPIPGYTELLSIDDAAAIVVEANDEYEAGIKIDAVKDDLGEFTPDSTDAEKIASANANKEGDRKLTVCGKSEFEKCGIIVSTEAITEGSYRPADFAGLGTAYEAMDKDPASKKFAVQLIDISTATEGEAFVVEGASYYVAVYGYVATEGNEAYHVKALTEPVVVE